jgi:hypothetical protein
MEYEHTITVKPEKEISKQLLEVLTTGKIYLRIGDKLFTGQEVLTAQTNNDMETEKDKKWGGKRTGAGRKKGPISKSKFKVTVPEKYATEIKEKISKLITAYEEKCKKEL